MLHGAKNILPVETLTTDQTMEILRQRLQLAPVKNTKLIAITVYSDDKNEAAQMANAVAEAYRDYRVQTRSELVAKANFEHRSSNTSSRNCKFKRPRSECGMYCARSSTLRT